MPGVCAGTYGTGEGLANDEDTAFSQDFTGVYKQEAMQTLPWFAHLGNHDYEGNTSAQLSPVLKALDQRWNAWRSQQLAFTPAGYDKPLLSVMFIDTIPWLASFRTNGKFNFAGLTPPVYANDTPVAGLGAAPAAAAGAPAPSCAYCGVAGGPCATCSDAAVWKAWENAQLAQLEGWLQGPATWKMVTGHVQIQSDHSGDQPELAPVQALLQKYGVPLYMNGA